MSSFTGGIFIVFYAVLRCISFWSENCACHLLYVLRRALRSEAERGYRRVLRGGVLRSVLCGLCGTACLLSQSACAARLAQRFLLSRSTINPTLNPSPLWGGTIKSEKQQCGYASMRGRYPGKSLYRNHMGAFHCPCNKVT